MVSQAHTRAYTREKIPFGNSYPFRWAKLDTKHKQSRDTEKWERTEWEKEKRESPIQCQHLYKHHNAIKIVLAWLVMWNGFRAYLPHALAQWKHMKCSSSSLTNRSNWIAKVFIRFYRASKQFILVYNVSKTHLGCVVYTLIRFLFTFQSELRASLAHFVDASWAIRCIHTYSALGVCV